MTPGQEAQKMRAAGERSQSLLDLPSGKPQVWDAKGVKREVTQQRVHHQGAVFNFVSDAVVLQEQSRPVWRDYLQHPGAVAVVAIRAGENGDEILLLRQYRHAAATELWEIPAGLLDKPGEDPVAAAARELAEETGLAAQQWQVLVDTFNSPGCSSESLRIFLARELTAVVTDYVPTDEEADFSYQWVRLADALDAVTAGQLHNSTTQLGILATWYAASQNWANLRPVTAPWLR